VKKTSNCATEVNPEAAPWLAQGGEKRRVVQQMFAAIAPSYDRINGLITFSLHHRWRQIAVRSLQLQPGDHVLDVCCGTGDFLEPLRNAVGAEGHLEGSDFCRPMLEIAQKKPHHRAHLSLADACDLPYSSSRFDAVTVGWGIRNVPDIDQAHREAFRVLKPGGRFVSLDTAQPRNPILRAVSRWISGTLIPWFGRRFGHEASRAYKYLPESTLLFKSRVEIQASMEAAGFRNVTTRDFFFGNICLWRGEKP